MAARAHLERLQSAPPSHAAGSSSQVAAMTKIEVQQKEHAYARHTHTYSFNTLPFAGSDKVTPHLIDCLIPIKASRMQGIIDE